MGAPYIYDISRLRVKDLHSATYIYVVRRLRVKRPFGTHSTSIAWWQLQHIFVLGKLLWLWD